jgi:hypothetical protein
VISSFFDQHQFLLKSTCLKDIDNIKTTVAEYVNNYRNSSDEKKNTRSGMSGPLPQLPSDTSPVNEVPLTSKNVHHNHGETARNPWELIDKYHILQAKESATKSLHESESRKKRMAMDLNNQIKEKEDSMNKTKDEYRKFIKSQEQAIKKWEQEQQNCVSKEKQKAEELRKVRENQIQERLRLKEMNDANKKEEESKEIKEIKKALMKEEEVKQRRKLKEREKWENIMKENLIKLEEQKRCKEEEEKMQAKLMADMKEKMDKEEAKRIEALQIRRQKLELNRQLLTEKGAFKKRDEIRHFEQSLLKAAQDRERAQMEEEEKRKENMRNRIRSIQETNKKMIDDKRRIQEMLAKEKEAFAAQCLTDAETISNEEQAKLSKQKESKMHYREILKSQMQEQKQRITEKNAMTPAEWSMNKKIIDDAQKFLQARGEL